MKKVIVLFMFFVFLMGINQSAFAFSNKDIVKGSTGNDVIELQARLQNIGYYRGKIDGIFYYETYWALRNFQKNFGMKITGVADAATRKMLTKASHYNEKWVLSQIRAGNEFTYYQGVPISKQVKVKSTSTTKKNTTNNTATTNQKTTTTNKGTTSANKNNTTASNNNANANTQIKPKETIIPPGFSANDIKLMANAVHGEARGESYEGRVAVAAVIINRIQSSSFPDTVSGVIFQPGAFTAVADGQIYLTPDDTSKKAVIDAINGWDPTENSIYYFNPATATNKWIWGRPQVKKIGKHIFCK